MLNLGILVEGRILGVLKKSPIS